MELTISIIQQCRDYLGADPSLNAAELYKALREARKRKHPDLFTDPEAIKQANEECKKISELLTSLAKFVQTELLRMPSSELALYDPVFLSVSLQRENDNLSSEKDYLSKRVSELEDLVKYYSERIEALEKKKVDEQKISLEREQKELAKLYQPKGRQLIPLGVVLGLSALIPIFAKFEEVAGWLSKYAPFPDHFLRPVLFVAFVCVILSLAKRIFENRYVTNRSHEIDSAVFTARFADYISSKRSIYGENQYFSEREAYEFVANQPNKYLRLLGKFGFRGVSSEANNRLTTLFISRLLQKELITISNASMLDRRFNIKKSPKDSGPF